MKRLPLVVFGLVLVALFAIGAAQIYANKKAEEELRKIIAVDELEDKVSYEDVRYSLFGGFTEVKGLVIKDNGGSLSIDKLVIKEAKDTLYDVSAYGIKIDDPKYSKTLKEVDYVDEPFNMHMRLSIDDDNKVFNLEHIAFELPRPSK